MGANGKKRSVALKETASVTAQPGQPGGGEGGQKGALPPFMTGGQLTGMITNKQMPNALNMLVMPGDTAKDILMRSRFSKKTEGQIFIKYLVYNLYRNMKYHNENGANALLMLSAALVSEGGMGRTEVVRAVTGDREHEELKGGGMGAWLRKTAWGEGKKDSG